jgi:hypothetical protein
MQSKTDQNLAVGDVVIPNSINKLAEQQKFIFFTIKHAKL